MKNHRALIGITCLFACSISVIFSATYFIGWLIREIQIDNLGYFLLLTSLVPIVSAILSGFGEKLKYIVGFANMLLFVIAFYLYLPNVTNALVPEGLYVSTNAWIYFSLILGATFSFFMIGSCEIARLSRTMPHEWQFLIGIAFIAGNIATAAIVYYSGLGWLVSLVIPMIMMPASLSIYYLLNPLKNIDRSKMKRERETLEQYVIKDKSKGFKLVIFSIFTLFNLGLLLGVNGIELSNFAYHSTNWTLYIFIGIGSGLTIYLAWIFTMDLVFQRSSRAKEFKSQVVWLIVVGAQFTLTFIALYLENFNYVYHGTLVFNTLDGLIIGIHLGLYYYILMLQHVKRMFNIYVMLGIFMLAFFIALGNTVKGVVIIGGTYTGMMEYYTILIEIDSLIFIFTIIPIVATTIIRGVKMLKTPTNNKKG
ncbi:MAG: hypothetical protein ACTSWN_17175 [Promethearchaeota archaeon]